MYSETYIADGEDLISAVTSHQMLQGFLKNKLAFKGRSFERVVMLFFEFFWKCPNRFYSMYLRKIFHGL